MPLDCVAQERSCHKQPLGCVVFNLKENDAQYLKINLHKLQSRFSLFRISRVPKALTLAFFSILTLFLSSVTGSDRHLCLTCTYLTSSSCPAGPPGCSSGLTRRCLLSSGARTRGSDWGRSSPGSRQCTSPSASSPEPPPAFIHK